MIRKLKTFQVALLLACAMGAVVAQGASAAKEHEFHSDGERTVITGETLGIAKYTIGAVGVAECTATQYEATQTGTEVSGKTFKSDTLTVVPHYSGCTFGGAPATVNFNHCAYVFDSDTTAGNTDGGEHANVALECSEGSKVEIDTALCTVTIAAQTLTHAVSYENVVPSAITVKTTAKSPVISKARTTAAQPVNGCVLFPTGAVGTLTSTATFKCFKDGGKALEGTEKTTPAGTEEDNTTDCGVNGAVEGDVTVATVFTGRKKGSDALKVGSAGTLGCSNSVLEGTVSEKEAEAEPTALTLKPTLSGCTFGVKEAIVKTNDCAYVFDQSTNGEGHADLEIECAKEHQIEIDTSECTITIGAQLIEGAVHYEEVNGALFTVKVTTAENGIVTGKAKTTESQTGCEKFPTGAIGTYTGTQLVECLKDTAPAPQADPTTPGSTNEGQPVECPFKGA